MTIAPARHGATVTQLRPAPDAPGQWDHDSAAERAVLAAIMMDEGGADRVWARVSAILGAQDFHVQAHVEIFGAMERIVTRGALIEFVILCAELRACGRINTVGGVQYVAELADYIPGTAHCETHARIVADHRARREVAQIGRALSVRAHDLSRPIDATMSGALATMEAVRLQTLKPRSMSDDVAEYFAAVAGEIAPGRAPVATGLADLDAQLLGGLRAGSYLFVAAGGEGKTTLMVQIALHVAATRGPVLFVEKEESRAAIRDKCLAHLARLPLAQVMRAREAPGEAGLTDAALQALFDAGNRLDGLPLYLFALDDVGTPDTAHQVFAVARAMRPPPELIVVDNLGELVTRGHYGPSGTAEATREKMTDLRAGAQSFGVPVLTLAHPKAGVVRSKARMCLGDIAGGENAGKLCAGAFFLHNEERNPTRGTNDPPPMPGVLELYSDKLRGPVSAVFCEIRRVPSEHRFASRRRQDDAALPTNRSGLVEPTPDPFDAGEGLPVDEVLPFPGEQAPVALAPKSSNGTEGAVPANTQLEPGELWGFPRI